MGIMILGLVTYNGTSWATCREYMEKVDGRVQVVFLQEHHLQYQEQLDTAAAFLRRIGWDFSLWRPGGCLLD